MSCPCSGVWGPKSGARSPGSGPRTSDFGLRDPRSAAAALSLTPCRGSGLRRHAIERIGLEQLHGLFDGALELRILPGDHVLGPVLDVDIGCDPFVLDRPFAVPRDEAAARRD